MSKYVLHYGTDSFNVADARTVTGEIDEAIASGGAWVPLTTADDRTITLLVGIGVPIWVETISEGPTAEEVGERLSRIIY